MRTVQARLDRAAAIADATIYRHDPGHRVRPGRGGSGGLVGVLTPAAYAARHPADRAYVHAECLLEAGPDAVLTAQVRWLQITTREQQVLRSGGASVGPEVAFDADPDDQAEFLPHEVDEDVTIADLLAAGPGPITHPSTPSTGTWPRGWLPHLSAPRPAPWEPAGAAAGGPGVARSGAHTVRLSAPSGRQVRTVDHGGTAPTRITWDTWFARAELRLSAGLYPGPHPLLRLRAELVNISGWPPHADEAHGRIPVGWAARAPHGQALRHALIGAHVILGIDRGRFVSLSAPPAWAAAVARDCVNDGLWPAVVGGPGGDPTAVLLAPVRIPDDPGPRPTPSPA
ncbi:hypothetical protein FF36_01304 [Frankia torreyi]|uniref:Uncharacterized protein n=1 Tax=Frankia torreyi TaxID=1856 RepID=A0A0D8BJQ6_9ACTN|nr:MULTISPECIES: hypothetical protein [Frankia]KJE24229.1 hypothetical protein FF36_01304 [Frankia torreyi]KQC38052.1 hypothetical protein UK82_11950 [Frankia sp. ACN1ag]KQM06895.1 hypothetical protein FF86_1006148 [Frankia sp. CpI1-P]